MIMSDSNRNLSENWDNLTSWIPFEKLDVGTKKRPQDDQLVSNGVRDVVMYIAYVVLCNGIGLCGIVGNMLNIVVYWKQGFKTSINVSFFSLSLSDLFVAFFFLWAGISLAPDYARHSDTTALVSELHLVVAKSQRLTFIRLSVWITAFIAVERCMCILRPHKVRTYFTPKRSALVIAVTFVLVTASAIPVYHSIQLKKDFAPLTNSSRLQLTFTPSHLEMRDIRIASAASLQLLSLLVVMVSNSILLVSYRKQTSLWDTNAVATTSSATQSFSREPGPSQGQSPNPQQEQLDKQNHGICCTNLCQGSNRPVISGGPAVTGKNGLLTVPANIPPSIHFPTASSSPDPSSSKKSNDTNNTANSTEPQELPENTLAAPPRTHKPRLHLHPASNAIRQKEKLAKMILILSGITLATNIPSITVYLVVSIDGRFGLTSRQANLTRVLWSVISVVETLNASFNIVIYYRMNSRYKETLQDIKSWLAKLRTNGVAPSVDIMQARVAPSVDIMQARVAPSVDNMQARVAPSVDNMQARVAPSVDNMQARVTPSVDNMQDRVAPSVDYVQDRVAPSVDNMQARVAPSVDYVQDRVAPSVDNMQARVAPSVDIMQARVAPSVDNVQARVAPSVDIVQARVTPSVDNVQSNSRPRNY